MKRLIFFGLGVITLTAIIAWAYAASSQPLPGVANLQPGREHHPQGTQLTYNFNPPTSGDHYPTWITKGVYDTPRIDGNLVHSLEHGYIILWYDCAAKLQTRLWWQPQVVYADEAASGSTTTSGGEGSPSAELKDLPAQFSDGSCDTLKGQLTDLYNNLGPHKLIVVPRPGINKPLILTAWGKTLELDQIDQQQIKKFIDSYRDQGPERTNEP